MIKKKLEYVMLIAIILAICFMGNYYLNLKSGYHVDEGMTLFLANGQYNGAVTTKPEYNFVDFLGKFVWKGTLIDTAGNIYKMLQDVIGAGDYSRSGAVEWYDATRSMLQGQAYWITGEELFGQVIAPGGNRFQYMQTYINQAMDVHPPLYYFMVHTVFSIFCNSYSDYYLFVINMASLIATCIMLFSIMRNIADDKACAFLAVCLYGFSQGFFSCALYFRMYALETFFIVATLYV